MEIEQPLYLLKPEKSRILIPNTLKLVGLCILFYLGVFLNITLLNIEIPSYINILIGVILLVLVILENILSFVKLSKIKYVFYQNRIQVEGPKPQYIFYANILAINPTKGFLDKFFNTGSIDLGIYKIKAIANISQTANYIQQLVQFSRAQMPQR